MSGLLPVHSSGNIWYEKIAKQFGAGTVFPYMILARSNQHPVLSSSFFNSMEDVINSMKGENYPSNFSINGLSHLDAFQLNLHRYIEELGTYNLIK